MIPSGSVDSNVRYIEVLFSDQQTTRTEKKLKVLLCVEYTATLIGNVKFSQQTKTETEIQTDSLTD